MMTTLVEEATTPAPAAPRPRTTNTEYRLTLGRLIRSEAIKLVSLRSPWWSAALVAVISLGMATLYAAFVASSGETFGQSGNEIVANATLMSTMFTVLLASIIGTMLVTGEYSTGMIRSTITAAPDRLRSMVAKSLIAAAFIFTVSLATMIVSAAIAAAVLANADVFMDFTDLTGALVPYLCGALYLAAIGMMGVGIGYLVRNGAGAISVIVGITFVLPMIPGVIAMVPGMEWIFDVAKYLPTNAGYEFMMGADDARLQGGLVLLGWVVVTTVLGALVLKRRDA